MNNPQKDIALIRKYHNGELSPADKHKLEARALDDPFLQDALDGYETSGLKDDDLALLTQKLNEKIAPAKVITPVWGLKQWGIAASVIFCIALASIYFNQTPKNKTIALNDIQQKEDIPQTEKVKIAPTTDSIQLAIRPKLTQPLELAENKTPAKKTERYTPEPDIIVEPLASEATKKDMQTNLEEVAVIGYPIQKRQDITGAVSSISSDNLASARMMKAEKSSTMMNLKGKVIDEKDSTALPGVSIKNLATGETTQTNLNGEFSIEANQNSDLAISYLGYETKNKSIYETEDSMLIALAPSKASLSEVVVVGYGGLKKETDRIIGPKVGWSRFKQYVQNQAGLVHIGRGKVQLQFIINSNGEISDFKVIDAFSAKAGVAAINIIKNYNGGWVGSAENIPHKTDITIKFK